jgi:hypothetical protein
VRRRPWRGSPLRAIDPELGAAERAEVSDHKIAGRDRDLNNGTSDQPVAWSKLLPQLSEQLPDLVGQLTVFDVAHGRAGPLVAVDDQAPNDIIRHARTERPKRHSPVEDVAGDDLLGLV